MHGCHFATSRGAEQQDGSRRGGTVSLQLSVVTSDGKQTRAIWRLTGCAFCLVWDVFMLPLGMGQDQTDLCVYFSPARLQLSRKAC